MVFILVVLFFLLHRMFTRRKKLSKCNHILAKEIPLEQEWALVQWLFAMKLHSLWEPECVFVHVQVHVFTSSNFSKKVTFPPEYPLALFLIALYLGKKKNVFSEFVEEYKNLRRADLKTRISKLYYLKTTDILRPNWWPNIISIYYERRRDSFFCYFMFYYWIKKGKVHWNLH